MILYLPGFPVSRWYCRASLMAASVTSEPADSNLTVLRSPGAISAIRLASCTATGLLPCIGGEKCSTSNCRRLPTTFPLPRPSSREGGADASVIRPAAGRRPGRAACGLAAVRPRIRPDADVLLQVAGRDARPEDAQGAAEGREPEAP